MTSTRTIERWQAYFLHLCNHTKPHPKPKYIVIVCTKPKILGFLINSRINQYVKDRPHLLPCEVSIDSKRHTFLRYDSYVDCRDVFEFTESELVNKVGEISTEVKDKILDAVRVCPVIKRRDRKAILA